MNPLKSLYLLATASSTLAFAPMGRFHLRAFSSLASSADDEEYDLVVIGGGSGGVRASRIASGYGKKVAILEPQLQHGAPNYSAIGGTVSANFLLISKPYRRAVSSRFVNFPPPFVVCDYRVINQYYLTIFKVCQCWMRSQKAHGFCQQISRHDQRIVWIWMGGSWTWRLQMGNIYGIQRRRNHPTQQCLQ